jgi:sulfatase modifying factor 1
MTALGCTYRPIIPADVVRCEPTGTACPAPLRCLEQAAGTGSFLCSLPATSRPVADAAADGPLPQAPDETPLPLDAATARDTSVDADAGPEASSDAAAAFPVVEGAITCPMGRGPRMVAIEGGYCIDSTEVTNLQYAAFIQDPRKPAAGTLPPVCKTNTFAPWALPAGQQNLPANDVDWCDAHAYCKWAGKRLCGKIDGGSLSAQDVEDFHFGQWVRACTANGQHPYNYPGPLDRSRCDTDNPYDPPKLHDVGTWRACEGGYEGVYDMTGNVFEWIDACDGTNCYLAGGSWQSQPPSETGCQRSMYATPIESRADHIGFRCCSN